VRRSGGPWPKSAMGAWAQAGRGGCLIQFSSTHLFHERVTAHTIIRQLLVFLTRFFHSVIHAKRVTSPMLATPSSVENGNPVFPPRADATLRSKLRYEARVCLWHENFLDSRVRGNDNHAKRIWLRPSGAALRNILVKNAGGNLLANKRSSA